MNDNGKQVPRRAILKYIGAAGALFALGGFPWLFNKITHPKQLSSSNNNSVPKSNSVPSSMPATISIAQENQKPGNGDWKITQPAAGEIQGYASATSVNRGENIRFYVSTVRDGTTYNVAIYRLGWYQGAGARLVHLEENLTGKAQGWWWKTRGRHDLPPLTHDTRMLNLEWTQSYAFRVPIDWVSGYYLARLTDKSGYQSFIPFIVRDDYKQHDLMLQASVTTWHAYNGWGGTSLYGHYDDKTNKWVPIEEDMERHALAVSFNRPYEQNYGAGEMFLEYPMIFWMESLGYDVGYVTNIDTHLNRTKWLPKGFISLGHDEYYSREMRETVEKYRASGVHLAFLGANTMYWQSRLFNESQTENHTDNEEPRIHVCYKYLAHEDHVTNSKLCTKQWRELREPENEIIGQMYDSVVYSRPDWVISNPEHWLFTGLKVQKGDRVKGLIGWEYDCVVDNLFTPRNLEIIAESTFLNAQEKMSEAHSTIYRHWSGSYVFSSGTIYWTFGLANPMNDDNGAVDDRIQGVTANLLNKFIQGN